MKIKLDALNEKAQALAVKLYEQAAAEQQASGEQAGGEAPKDDNVVDGDFEEVK